MKLNSSLQVPSNSTSATIKPSLLNLSGQYLDPSVYSSVSPFQNNKSVGDNESQDSFILHWEGGPLCGPIELSHSANTLAQAAVHLF